MDEFYEVSLLLDFYGQMITKRQYDILDLYYNSDLSLGEIAQQLSISRQGVYDNLRRGKAALYGLEEKLGLVLRFRKLKDNASAILKCLDAIDTNALSQEDVRNIDNARELVRKILED